MRRGESSGRLAEASREMLKARPPNFRVAVSDVLEVGAPQILTAVADQLDPCRRLFDPHSGKAIDLSWSREGRYSLDVAASRSGALTVNEKRDADGRPVSSYWNCYNVGANERLFHTEFGVEVVAIDAGELDATVAGDEVATINRDGRIEVWDSAKKARDPIVLFRIDSEVRHVDLTISDVNQRSGGNEIIASDADGGLRIYSVAGKLLQVVSLDERVSRVAVGNVTGRPGREILAVDRKSGDVLVVFDGEVVGRIKAKSGKPFVDVATIGAIKPLDLTERHMAARFTPINDIRLGKRAMQPPRVSVGGKRWMSMHPFAFQLLRCAILRRPSRRTCSRGSEDRNDGHVAEKTGDGCSRSSRCCI